MEMGGLISKGLILSHYLRMFMIIFIYSHHYNSLFPLKAILHLSLPMWGLLVFLNLCICGFVKYEICEHYLMCFIPISLSFC